MRRLFMLLAIAVAGVWAASPEEQVKDAEKAFIAATTKNDFAALEKVFADELIYTHSTAQSDTRA